MGRVGARGEPASPVNPYEYTPAHLAEKILRDRTRLEGERRTVTVLFADAVGFTPLSERLGEETVYALMQGCFARMMDSVHHYEGTITQFLGDGVMALFGAPIANEDSARRAVGAAIRMRESLHAYANEIKRDYAIEFRFRIGLNTGPVVVGKIGDNLDMDYTAVGDTINLASRLEAIAEPGTVCVSETTFRAVGDFIECEPLGPLTVKGKAAPVLAFRVVAERAVRTRLEAAVVRGLTPLIGRERELSLLHDYLDSARRGRGQVVLISGDAGMGKSRLLHEFRSSLDGDVRWIEGHCISYGSNIPYLPIIDLLKARFGVEEGDDEEKIIRRIDEGTVDWDERARYTIPYLKYLLNVDPGDPAILSMDAMTRRAGIFDAFRASAVQNTRTSPSVVVIEDLHWIDAMSEGALSAVVDVAASVPMLMVFTHRPGYSPVGDRAHFNRIALAPLPTDESMKMVESLLGRDALAQPIEALVAGRSDGNPFYIEELTKSLLESDVLRWKDGNYSVARPTEQIVVPDTIQEVILSRIDRLPAEGKSAIQLASVIGREFTVHLLQRISDLRSGLDHILGDLKSLELIYEKAYLPELSYMFKHALTHDVAYSTLLKERRRALHRVVAAAIEELYLDRLADHYETLAYHYDLGHDWNKALDYLIKAGHKAADVFANDEALEFFARAIAAAEKVHGVPLETMADIYGTQAELYLATNGWSSAVSCYESLALRARAAGDRRVEGLALGGKSFSQVISHEFEEAEATAGTALAIADSLDDDAVRVGALMTTTFLGALRGDVASAMTNGEETARLARATGQPLYECFCDELFILGHSWRSLFDKAHQKAEAAVARATGYAIAEPLAFVKWAQGTAFASHGRYAEATVVLHDAVAFCRRIGDKAVMSRAWNTLGWIHGELYDFARAIEFNAIGLELAFEVGDPEITINAQLNLADCAIATGERDRALRDLEQLHAELPAMHEWMKWRYSQHLWHSLGEVVLAAGDVTRALELADGGLAVAVATESRKNITKFRRLRGQALAVGGSRGEAEAEFNAAVQMSHEAGNPPQVWKTWAAIGEFRRADDPVGAQAGFAEAAAVIDDVAAGLTDEGLRTTFLSAEPVLAIREGCSS